MRHDIVMIAVPEQRVISIRGHSTQEDLPGFIDRSFEDLYDSLGMLGAIGNGRPFVVYHGFAGGLLDVEACVPVSGGIAATGRLETHTLPSCTVARTVHVGPYEGIVLAYAALHDWADANHRAMAGPHRERYLVGTDDGVAPTAYRTEIDLPVTDTRVPVTA